ncbi:MAG: hypothetical protein GY798_10100 [Hyphomicrobiales bacterium]|nr:hypothetical protein [Hyphomicrobiales bacterium]
MRYFLAFAAASLVTAGAYADDKEISMSDVPETVLDAAKAAVEGATFTKVELGDDEGEDKYGFEGTLADGTVVAVDVLEEGEVIEVEHHTTIDALPAPVKAALDKYAPDMKAEEVERLVDDDRAVVYEIEGTDASGAPIDIEISWDGSEVTIETDDS